MRTQPLACDACHWETGDLREIPAYGRHPDQGPNTPREQMAMAWLCLVCRNTEAERAYCFPRQHQYGEVLFSLSWGINRIVAEIRAIRQDIKGGTPA